MLGIFRKLSNSFIAKFFIVLIVVSFMVVGGLSPFASKVGVVATVGNEKIYFKDFYNEYKTFLKMTGLEKASKQQLRTLQYAKYVLDSMVIKTAMQQEIEALKTSVSDLFVADNIKNSKYFQENGKFNSKKFESLLRTNGFTKETYIVLLKRDLNIERYKTPFSTIYPNFPNMVNILARNKEQTRSALKATKDKESIPIKNITQSGIRNYYNINPKSFATPEKRDVTVLLFNREKAAKKVSTKRAKTYYKKHIGQYTIPEKRSFYQFYSDKKTLQKFAFALKKGTKFEKAVKDILKQNLTDNFFENVSKDTIEPTLRKVAFAIKAKTLSNVHQGAFGNFVVYMKTIDKERERKFNKVEKAIKARIAQTLIMAEVDRAEKNLALGATLEEIAQRTDSDIKLEKDVLPTGGKDPFTKDPVFIKEIFTTKKGENTKLLQLSNKQYAFARIDTIKPSIIPPYETIKSLVKAAYRESLKTKELETQMQAFQEIKSEKIFRETAKKLKFKVVALKDITRDTTSSDPITSLIFNTKKDSTKAKRINDNGYVIFVQSITTPKSAKKSTRLEVESTLKEIEVNGVLNTIYQYLSKKYPVSINTNTFEKVYN